VKRIDPGEPKVQSCDMMEKNRKRSVSKTEARAGRGRREKGLKAPLRGRSGSCKRRKSRTVGGKKDIRKTSLPVGYLVARKEVEYGFEKKFMKERKTTWRLLAMPDTC